MSAHPSDDLLVRALAEYLDQSLSTEGVIRELLAKAGFDDPELPVEECVAAMVTAYLRLAVPS